MKKIFPFVLLGGLVSLGSYWAFVRGANDFNVFYYAWKIVLQGHGRYVYDWGPDRYLYAPGFAYLFAPLAWLPRTVVLSLFCLLKALLLGWMIQKLTSSLKVRDSLPILATLIYARPLLIDFQYGQINLIVATLCCLTLIQRFQKKQLHPNWTFVLWMAMSWAAFSKIYTLIFLLVPWALTVGVRREQLRAERQGVICGLALIAFVPFLFEGRAAFHIYYQWYDALRDKGIPLDSHNQSFVALLAHFFTGHGVEVLSQAYEVSHFGIPILKLATAKALGQVWAMIAMSLNLGWMLTGARRPPVYWVVIALAIVFLPSHLIWKPYFVFGIPLAIWVFSEACRLKSRPVQIYLLMMFVGMNLTSFDVIGVWLAARLEAASLFLLLHLGLIGAAMKLQKQASRVRG